MNVIGILSCILLICTTTSSSVKYKVIIKSTSPVALDTPIWFTAEIFPGENKNYSFYWKDNTGFSQKIVTEGPKSNWSIIYPTSKYQHSTGSKTVTVQVSNADAFMYSGWLAKGYLTYTLNSLISGTISVTQPNVTGIKPGCISTLNSTNITTSLHDPFDWIKDRTEQATFYYHINRRGNSRLVGPCLSPSILVNITEPGRYIIEATVILVIASHPTTTTEAPTTTTSTTASTPVTTNTSVPTTSLAPNISIQTFKEEELPLGDYVCGVSQSTVAQLKEENKYTFAVTSVTAAEPLSLLKVTGDTWLKHGAMLRLNISCTGTGPYSYCFNIAHGAFSESDPKICTHHRIGSNECDFEIHYYLPHNGTYSLVLTMDNDISSRIERHALHVYNADKEKQLTYIIVPMTCAIIAIIMIIFGVARYIQNKNRYSIEVADFDFGASDEHVYKPFIQQLRDAITSSCSANLEDHRKRRYIEHPQILEDD